MIAFLILWALLLANGEATSTQRVASSGLEQPAVAVLQPATASSPSTACAATRRLIARQVASHTCAGAADRRLRRDDAGTRRRRARRAAPELRRPAALRRRRGIKRTRLGFRYAIEHATTSGRSRRPESSVDRHVGRHEAHRRPSFARIFNAEERKQLAASSAPTRSRASRSGSARRRALTILALISLSLAIINLFPFLPLDGGHIFWALAEKVRGRAMPFSVMERASAVGFVLVIMLFVIGLSNDIGRLQNGGFNVR